MRVVIHQVRGFLGQAVSMAFCEADQYSSEQGFVPLFYKTPETR